jgi:hypothetical protein
MSCLAKQFVRALGLKNPTSGPTPQNLRMRIALFGFWALSGISNAIPTKTECQKLLDRLTEASPEQNFATPEDIETFDFLAAPMRPMSKKESGLGIEIESIARAEFPNGRNLGMDTEEIWGRALHLKAKRDFAHPVEFELKFIDIADHITTADGTLGPLFDILGYIPSRILGWHHGSTPAKIRKLSWNKQSIEVKMVILHEIVNLPTSNFNRSRDIPGLFFQPKIGANKNVIFQSHVQRVDDQDIRNGFFWVEIHADIRGDLKTVRDLAMKAERELGVVSWEPVQVHMLRYRDPIMDSSYPLQYSFGQRALFIQVEKALVMRDLVENAQGVSLTYVDGGILFGPVSKDYPLDSRWDLDILLSDPLQPPKATFKPAVEKGYLGYRGPGFYRDPQLEGYELRNIGPDTTDLEFTMYDAIFFNAHFPLTHGIPFELVNWSARLNVPKKITREELKSADFRVYTLDTVLDGSIVFYDPSKDNHERWFDVAEYEKNPLGQQLLELYYFVRKDNYGLTLGRAKKWYQFLKERSPSIEFLTHLWREDIGLIEIIRNLPEAQRKKFFNRLNTLAAKALKKVHTLVEREGIVWDFDSETRAEVDKIVVQFLQDSGLQEMFQNRYLQSVAF